MIVFGNVIMMRQNQLFRGVWTVFRRPKHILGFVTRPKNVFAEDSHGYGLDRPIFEDVQRLTCTFRKRVVEKWIFFFKSPSLTRVVGPAYSIHIRIAKINFVHWSVNSEFDMFIAQFRFNDVMMLTVTIQ